MLLNNSESCKKCKLCETSSILTRHGMFTAVKVMGSGSKNATIMFIGEALGNKEVITKIPFTGSAGNLLNEILTQVGLNRDEVYTTNICKCRPPDNRIPKASEIKACLPFLLEEIKSVKPKVICTLGSVALKIILGKTGLQKIRGNVIETKIQISKPVDAFDESAFFKVKVLPTYHPAYVLRFPEYSYRKDFIKDLILLKKISETDNYQKQKSSVNYFIFKTITELEEYILKIKQKKLFAYDLETAGFNFLKDDIIAIQLSCKPNEAVGLDLREFSNEQKKEIFFKLKEIFESKEILKIGQNIKFDNKFLKQYGIIVKLPMFDTMLAHFLIDENSLHGLSELAYKYTDMGGYDNKLTEVFKKLKQELKSQLLLTLKSEEISEEKFVEEIKKLDSYSIIPKEVLLPYGLGDVDCTIRLYYIFKELLKKEGLTKLHQLILMPLEYVLTETEYNGVKIDIDYLKIYEKELREQITDLEYRIKNKPEIKKTEKLINTVEIEDKKSGIVKTEIQLEDKKYKPFNIKSTKHLQILLFTVGNLRPIIKTKTGYSTNAATLEILAETSELAKMILELRHLQHDLTTYVVNLKNHMDKNNYVHTNYKIHGAVTGRIISHKPNLQNIPRESKVKRLFAAEKNCIILSADYRQMEYRCLKEGSQVLMKDFSTKNIEDVLVGDKVLSIEEYSHNTVRKLRVAKVLKTLKQGIKKCVKVIDNLGNSIITTSDHKFLKVNIKGNETCWKALKNNDICYSFNRKYFKIIERISLESMNKSKVIIEEDKAYNTYDLTTSTGTFICNNFFVHNCWANYSKDEAMLEDIRNGLDIHSEVACYVWPKLYKYLGPKKYLMIQTGKIKPKVSGLHRIISKAVVFGLMFGRGVKSLVDTLGISESEANKIIKWFFNKYPGANRWLMDRGKVVKRDKQIKNLFGRVRRIPEIDSNNEEKRAKAIRQAKNTPIQSGASDMCSIATTRVYNAIKKANLKTRLILTIHDSLKYNVPVEELNAAVKCVIKGMTASIPGINFPLEVELEIGLNWLDLIDYEDFIEDKEKYLNEWNLK